MKRRRINKAKRFDSRCRNHGSCPHCRRARLYQANREIERFEQKLREEEEPTAFHRRLPLRFTEPPQSPVPLKVCMTLRQ